jgi:hypothetical protein
MGKKAIVAYEDRRRAKRAAKEKAAECPPASVSGGGPYEDQVEACLKVLGRVDPASDIDKSKEYIEHAKAAGVDARTTAAIIDATLGHAHLKHSAFVEGALETATPAPPMAAMSPTRDEWQVIIQNPPAGSRGAILSIAPPGEAYTVGRTIVLGGFYDDVEARHVAASITQKYHATVSYGPKSTFGVSEVPGVPGGSGGSQEPVKTAEECGCPHGGDSSETPPAPVMAAEDSHPKTGSICQPFTRVERDHARFKVCMARAKEIGEINNALALYKLISPEISKRDSESFYCVCFDFRGSLRDFVELNIGQRHRVAVDVEDILAVAILSKCDGFAVVHCHPSGDANPSSADKKLTKHIRAAQQVACPNIPMTDHVIIGSGQFFSFADNRLHKV